RRASNGRSLLVRKQSQITAFFSSPSPSTPNTGASKHSPSPLNPTAKPSPSPLNPTAASRSKPSPSPLNPTAPRRSKPSPSPLNPTAPRRSKLAAASPSPPKQHPPPPARKLRRLRRISDTAAAKSPAEAEDGAGDSTEDEDWNKDTVAEDVSEEVELDDEEEVVAVRSRKGKTRNSLLVSCSTPSTLGSGLTSASGSTISKKRKKLDVGSLDCAKRFSFEAVNTTGKADPEMQGSCGQKEQTTGNANTALTGEAAERFGQRDVEKFKFLGAGRKDAKGRCTGSPGYDPRTVLLPSQFLKGLTG
ncbi:unnamed protein product, partial [Urochloa humidicola]